MTAAESCRVNYHPVNVAGPWKPVRLANGGGRSSRRFAIAAAAAAVLIAAYGALLRLEVVAAKYGPLDHPAWARALYEHAVPLARHMRPRSLEWSRVAVPYVGGDPINYLRFAREMEHFYQPHVREPMFLAATRSFLWLLNDRDVAVSFASATASALVVLAIWLLGAAAFSRGVGLAAALAFAIEYDAILWAADGWRDDLFALSVTVSAWRFVRLRQDPGRLNAVWAGIAASASCLTRITALSFVVPGLIWLAASAPRPVRAAAARSALLSAAVIALLVGPYLISCAIGAGDPFLSINAHTRYYRAAEGLAADPSVSAIDYASSKVIERPTAALDTAAMGIVVWPFRNKWGGFHPWSEALAMALRSSAVIGLFLFLWTPDGRLLLFLLACSLVPYALTWPLGSGGEWRFTAHAYPVYLLAAFFAPARLGTWAVRILRRDFSWNSTVWRRLAEAALVAAVAAAASMAFARLPFLVAREALAAGTAVTLAAGDRDGMYFLGDWSAPQRAGENVTVRAALGPQARVRVPLPLETEYMLTLRIDPAETSDPAVQPRVAVFLNGRAIGNLSLTRTPGRVGLYRIRVPRELSGRTFSRLDLLASHTVPAADAGPHFSWLDPQTPVAFRLWYVRLEPLPPSQGSMSRRAGVRSPLWIAP